MQWAGKTERPHRVAKTAKGVKVARSNLIGQSPQSGRDYQSQTRGNNPISLEGELHWSSSLSRDHQHHLLAQTDTANNRAAGIPPKTKVSSTFRALRSQSSASEQPSPSPSRSSRSSARGSASRASLTVAVSCNGRVTLVLVRRPQNSTLPLRVPTAGFAPPTTTASSGCAGTSPAG